jgi:hypothetical protein
MGRIPWAAALRVKGYAQARRRESRQGPGTDLALLEPRELHLGAGIGLDAQQVHDRVL